MTTLFVPPGSNTFSHSLSPFIPFCSFSGEFKAQHRSFTTYPEKKAPLIMRKINFVKTDPTSQKQPTLKSIKDDDGNVIVSYHARAPLLVPTKRDHVAGTKNEKGTGSENDKEPGTKNDKRNYIYSFYDPGDTLSRENFNNENMNLITTVNIDDSPLYRERTARRTTFPSRRKMRNFIGGSSSGGRRRSHFNRRDRIRLLRILSNLRHGRKNNPGVRRNDIPGKNSKHYML